MIRNLIFDVGDVLVEYRWFEMLTRDYGLSEAEAKRIGEEMFDNEIWVQGLDGGRLSLEEANILRRLPSILQTESYH